MEEAVRHFEIRFSDPRGTYMEGQELRGQVVVDLNQDTVVERLVIEFVGSAVVDWLKSQPSHTKTGVSVMMGAVEEEEYLNQKLVLYTRGDHGRKFLVSSGRHSYPFRIQLPYNLPSTFEAEHGSVRYTAKATLHRPWQSKVTTSKDFTLFSVVDLAVLPGITRPMKCEMYQEQTVLFCVTVGHVSATWRIDRVGYLPRQAINIVGEIHNNTHVRLKKSRATLIQHVRYNDRHGHSLHEKKELVHIQKGEVLPGSVGYWREQLYVPEVPPTGLKGCNLMDIGYSLKIKVVPTGLLKKVESSTSLTIGSVDGSVSWSTSEPLSAGLSSPSGGTYGLDTNYFI